MGGLVAQLAAAGAFDSPAADDPEPERNVVYLWPECVPAWHHWQRLQTQWRVGVAGREGLDYAGVHAYLDQHAPRRGARRRALFAGIQACEVACLNYWAELREQQAQAQPQPPPQN